MDSLAEVLGSLHIAGDAFKQTVVMSTLGAEWKLVDAAAKARYEEMAKIPVE